MRSLQAARLARVTILALLLLPAFVIAQRPADGPAPGPVAPIDDVLGRWRNDTGEAVDITLLDPNDKARCAAHPCGVSLRGKHEWAGHFERGELQFITDPAPEAMNARVP